jgi:hypothetical protein
LLSTVITLEPRAKGLEDDLERFHSLRNDLYHSGLPITVSPSKVVEHGKLARRLLDALYGMTYSNTEWEELIAAVSGSLSGSSSGVEVLHTVAYQQAEGLVIFSTSGNPVAEDAISLSLHGFAILTGASPSRPSLIQSLARSGHPISTTVLSARIQDLRRKGALRANELMLSSKGRKNLATKYNI